MISLKNSAESQYLTSYNDFITGLVGNDLLLEIKYESDSVTDNAFFAVTFNGVMVKKINLINEMSEIRLELMPGNRTQVLELSMFDKGPGGTVVENGVIVKDTFFKLTDLKINNYRLIDDYDFFYNKTEYIRHQDNEKIQPSIGFWENATLRIKFDLPFDLWYNTTSLKNANLSETLKFRSDLDELDLLISDLEQSLKKLI